VSGGGIKPVRGFSFDDRKPWIIVRHRRLALIGVVDNETDEQLDDLEMVRPG
jgi:hypothetical protein